MKLINNELDMYADIIDAGIIPFFRNHIPGYSIEDLTPREHWFDGDELGPWDWKIYAVQSGNVAYGKFLLGGKAAFATAECYFHLMNWKRSLAEKGLDEAGERVMDFVRGNGSCTTGDVRRLLGIKKAAADALLTRLEARTLLIIGDFERIYREPDLHYSGWQKASFCRPEDFFAESVSGNGGPFAAFEAFAGEKTERSLDPKCTPEESRAYLASRIRRLAPSASDRDIERLLG